MSGNTCWWCVSFENNSRTIFCNKAPADSWRSAEHNYNHEINLVGVEFVYNSIYGDTVVKNSNNHWAFQYTGISLGETATLPEILGYEVDGCWTGVACTENNAYCPAAGTTKLAESPFNVIEYNPDGSIKSICTGGVSYMTIYTASSGGQVFATGSMM